MELDDALTHLGAYGKWQILIYFAISLFDNFLSIWHMSVSTFIAFEPEHRCKVPEGLDFNKTIPFVRQGRQSSPAKCSMHPYDNATGRYSNDTVPCSHGYWFNPDPIRSSVVNEWNLVCDKNVLPEISVMVFNIGVMVGAIVLGFMSDKYGRKKVFISSCVLQAVIGSLVSASPNFYVFTVLRFLVGALEQGVNITGFIMATELFPPKQRTVAAVSHEFFWAIGGAFLPIFAYFLRSWRPLQICVSVPGALVLVLIWCIPESLVWLLAKGRLKEAEEILKKAAKFNGKSLPPNVLTDQVESTPMLPPEGDKEKENGNLPAAPSKQRTYTVLDCFRTPQLRKISICTCGLWALNTMVYYGLSYNTPNLKGNMYLNFFIGQMVEIPSVAFTLLLIYKVGRRWPFCLCHVFGGIVCIASPFIPLETDNGDDTGLAWVAITLAMAGKFAINASFTIIYLYGPEIYPTVLRNTGAGLGSFAGRFGGILFPYVTYLAKIDVPYAKGLPLIVFGALSIIGGFLVLPLPETRNNPLPETIDDVENYADFCQRHRRAAKASPTTQGS